MLRNSVLIIPSLNPGTDLVGYAPFLSPMLSRKLSWWMTEVQTHINRFLKRSENSRNVKSLFTQLTLAKDGP